jgi:hypothetical protein
VSIDSNIKHREILRRPCPVHSTNFRVVGQKLYGENHRIALVRTAREERANCVQYSPCIAISLIGEFRLKDEPARAGMAQASPSRFEENLDAGSKA